MTARDRLATARRSSNLADRDDTITDVSVLAAAGMVASGNAVGMALLRLRDTMDRHEWPMCLSAVATRVRAVERGHKSRITEREMHDIAEHVLRAWVAPTCPACGGRGHQQIAGTPLMSDDPCNVCGGAGSLPIDYGLRGSGRGIARVVAVWMDRCAYDAAASLRGKLYIQPLD